MILRFGHLVPELIKKVYKIWQWLTKKGFFLPLVKNYKILKKCWNNRFSWIIGRYPNLSTIVKFINHLSIQRKIIGSKRGTTVTARGRVQHTQLGHLWFCANESFKRTVAGSISRVVGANWSWAWPLQCTHAVSISRKKDSLFVDWSSKCVFLSHETEYFIPHEVIPSTGGIVPGTAVCHILKAIISYQTDVWHQFNHPKVFETVGISFRICISCSVVHTPTAGFFSELLLVG